MGHDYKKVLIKMLTYLDYFSHTVGKLARRECFQKGGIDENVFWLPECANKIFSMRSVDGGFSTNTRINHGQQSRRYLNEAYTPHTEADKSQFSADLEE